MRILNKTKTKPNAKNFKWFVLLFIAIALFLIGFTTGQILYSLVAIIIALIVRLFGYDSLFGEFNAEQKAKKEERDKMLKTVQKSYKKNQEEK